MIIQVCAFTDVGRNLAKRLFERWQEMIPRYREKDKTLEQWTGECFQKHLPILFIGACGIAVRAIAPFVKDKLEDSAVLVMDEKGKYVIPLLSGHVGGANALASKIAEVIGATPVLTTATDVEGVFSVDVFARDNGLRIVNREGIKNVSGKLLRGEKVTIAWEPGVEITGELPEGLEAHAFEEIVDVRIVSAAGEKKFSGERQELLLVAREWALGLGCKRGKRLEDFQAFLSKEAPKGWEENVYACASVDLKAKEEGLWEFAQFYHLPFVTYSAARLEEQEGEFSVSEFVKKSTGVSNVCERAAACLAGEGAELIVRKKAFEGMTFAVARRKVRLKF